MEKKIDEEKILNALQEIGFNHEESLIYRTLVKYGPRGATVRNLMGELQIKRTTIYTILQRLIEKEIIFEKQSSETTKMAKLFVCLQPTQFFDQVFTNKKKELQKIEDKKSIFTITLQDEYYSRKNIPQENLDPFIIPYFKQLFEKKWVVLSQNVEKSFGCNIYEYHINIPKVSRFIPHRGFNIYVFDEVLIKNLTLKDKQDLKIFFFPDDGLFLQELLEDDDLNYMIYFFFKRMEKKILENEKFGKFTRYKNPKIHQREIILFEKPYTSLYFENFEYIRSVLFPYNNKLYFLWAEKIELLKEMFKCVLGVENIPFK